MIELLAAGLALAFPALVIAGAVKDVASFTIPNWIPLALAGAFVPAALAAGLPPAALAAHAGLGFGALVLGMVLFAVRAIGGGDGKLMAAAVLWLGWPALPTFLLVTVIAGGALSLGLLALRAPALRVLVLSGPAWFVRLAEPKESVPYGLAIAAGALAAFPLSPFPTVFGAL